MISMMKQVYPYSKPKNETMLKWDPLSGFWCGKKAGLSLSRLGEISTISRSIFGCSWICRIR